MKRNLSKSTRLRNRAEKIIPSCSQTFSKAPSQFVQGVAPVFLKRGKGCFVWDVDGNKFVDYTMALAPLILGYSYPAVNRAAMDQIRHGTSFTLPHPLEVEVAELLRKHVPCAEMVRFGKNGSDATAGAIRAARAVTGREIVACCGYHGWQDWFICTTTRDSGIPRCLKSLTLPFRYNDIASLEKIFEENKGKIAAVIMEPVGVVEPQGDFLQKVRELTHLNGAILIFDEIVTGFRLAMGGAQELYGVVPDMACLGKAMANGFPISAVVGRRDIMRVFDDIFFSFTFGGEAVSLAASVATIRELERRRVLEHIWKVGNLLKEGYNKLAEDRKVSRFTQCIGLAPRNVVTFKDEKGEDWWALKSLFQQECIKRGLLFSGSHNLSLSHGKRTIKTTLEIYSKVMDIISEAIDIGDVERRLEGKPVQPVFRKA